MLCSCDHSFFYLWYSIGLEQTMLPMINSHPLLKCHPSSHLYTHFTQYCLTISFQVVTCTNHTCPIGSISRCYLDLYTINGHHMLAELENCIATDYQSYSIKSSIVLNTVGVDQMNGLPEALPASTDVNSLVHVTTCSQRPYLLTPPLAPFSPVQVDAVNV